MIDEQKKIISGEMTFFELRGAALSETALSEAALSGAALREAALSGAALSGAALSFAPLRVAAAVVAEAEERQGEEEEDKRFAYRRYRRSGDWQIFIVIVIGISPPRPHHSTFGHRNPYSTHIRCAEVWRGR